MNTAKALFLIVTLVSSLICVSASASLIGDTINARWQFGATDLNDDFVVGPGIEGNPWLGIYLDISESAISIDVVDDGATGIVETVVWTFSSLDWVGTPGVIVDVTPSTNWVDWSDDFVTFGENFVRVEFLNDVSFDASNDFLFLDIEATHIPEPTAAVLAVAAIFFVVGRRRR